MRRSEFIFEQIRSSILDGVFPEGGKLPTEERLCEEYSVSRPVIREALARLRVEGLIFSRQGSGTFVSKTRNVLPNEKSFAPVENLHHINQCFDFRLSIEGEASYYAALNHNDADLITIEATMGEMANAADRLTVRDIQDFEFHIAVSEASHINFFPSVIRSIRQQAMVGIKLAESLSCLSPSERLSLVLGEHEAVLEAIRKGDTEKARRTMRDHIDSSRKRLFQGVKSG